MSEPSSSRIASIDALRGLTILVMIFVNDVAGVTGTPGWMLHYHPWDADGMTFVDVVFPAFLFIVGMAIPFAFQARITAGDSLLRIWRHVIIRTVGLLICGVFMVNMYVPDANWAAPVGRHLWMFLAYLCIIMVWTTIPRAPQWRVRLQWGLRVTGLIGLALLAAIYRREDGSWMQTSWWGILGLIGWAYLVGCIVYTVVGRNIAALAGSIALLYCLFAADQIEPTITGTILGGWVNAGSQIGSHGAIVVSGILLGVVLMRGEGGITTHWQRMRWASLYGLAMAAAAVMLYRLHTIPGLERAFIINKNLATPPWCLWSSAITCWVWVAIYWTMDVKGWTRWAIPLRPAGENPLLAYILAPFIQAFFQITSISLLYGKLGAQFATGFPRSVVWAFAVTWLAGWMKKVGLRLKL